MALTARQAAFVREYQISGNASQSAVNAGYSEATAPQIGSRLLKNVHVKTALAKRETARTERLQRTADDIAAFHWSVIDDESVELRLRLQAANQEKARYQEYKDGVTIDQRQQSIVIPEGTTLEDLKKLRSELQ